MTLRAIDTHDEPTAGPEPPWRARRREAILAAAAALFARKPYHEVQMDEVAREAGLGKATLYRYFPSKEALYLDSFDHALAGLEERLHAPLPPDVGPAEALACKIGALVDTLSGQLLALKVLGGDHAQVAEQGRRVFRRRAGRIAAALRDALAAGAAAGVFRPLDPVVTPTLIIGMVRGAVMGAGDQPRERLERAILDLVLNGTLAAGSGRPPTTPECERP